MSVRIPVADAHHKLSDLSRCQCPGVCDLLDRAVVDHADGVRQIHDLIQLQRDQKDGFALVALVHDLFVDILDGADIQTAGGLNEDRERGIQFDLWR